MCVTSHFSIWASLRVAIEVQFVPGQRYFGTMPFPLTFFQFAGDMAHVASFGFLLYKLYKRKEATGKGPATSQTSRSRRRLRGRPAVVVGVGRGALPFLHDVRCRVMMGLGLACALRWLNGWFGGGKWIALGVAMLDGCLRQVYVAV